MTVHFAHYAHFMKPAPASRRDISVLIAVVYSAFWCPAIVCLNLTTSASMLGCARPPHIAEPGPATTPAPRGDAQKLFAEALAVLSSKPLGRAAVDWPAVGWQLLPTIPADAPAAAAHGAIRRATAHLNDPHATFFPPRIPAAVRAPEPAPAPATAATPAASQRIVPDIPSGQMLDGTIAYLTVPRCVGADADALQFYARTLRSEVLRLQSHRPVAWVIDLRFNGGGNVWPMLPGLYPLLGEGVLTTSVVNDIIVSRVGCRADEAWLERDGQRSVQLSIKPFGELSSSHATAAAAATATATATAHGTAYAPIAVLIGPWTMSSGELVALAFRGHSRFFGEPTAGLTTVTDYFPLADGSVLNLPIAHMADRTGWTPRGSIRPDEPIEAGDWPTESDAQATAAKAWAQQASHKK